MNAKWLIVTPLGLPVVPITNKKKQKEIKYAEDYKGGGETHETEVNMCVPEVKHITTASSGAQAYVVDKEGTRTFCLSISVVKTARKQDNKVISISS